MKVPKVKGADLTNLALGSLIGRGGEGEVYSVDGHDEFAAKIYTGGLASAREAKVRAFIEAGLARNAPMVSYPSVVILDDKNRFAGFLMRKVASAKPLFQLYKPIARKRHFPDADFRFLVHVALNVAKAVASVHHNNCIIGDVNESGVLVTEKGTVALIDADSFQFEWQGKRYVCEVGKPEYTAPELQNRSLKDVVRLREHDGFALAVLIFQLLWLGRHPFSGIYSGSGEMPLEKAISENRFAYSLRQQNKMTPPPGAVRLDMFPSYIGDLFEQAFGSSKRPTAEEWVSALTKLRADLRPCLAEPRHFYPSNARECPWCAVRRDQGSDMFPRPVAAADGAASTTSWSGNSDVVALWQAIERVAPPPSISLPTAAGITVSPSAEAAKAGKSGRKNAAIAVLSLLAAAGIFAYFPAYWLVWGFLGLIGVGRFFEGPETATFVKAYEAADLAYANAVSEWIQESGAERFQAAKSELLSSRQKLDALGEEENRRIAANQKDRHARQLRAWLEQFQISRSRIKGIGTAKIATLASFGIETAAEIERSRLLKVPGFGPVNSQPLLDWRRQLERRFVFKPQSDAADKQREAVIRADIASRAAVLRRELQGGPARLSKIAMEISAVQAKQPAKLQELFRIRLQAEADLKHLGLAIPPSRTSRTKPAPNASATGRGLSRASNPRSAPVVSSTPPPAAAPSCPRCSSRMVRRTARRGANAGNQFWGCSRYPSCKGTRS